MGAQLSRGAQTRVVSFMKFRFADLVGRYRLIVSAEILDFIERAFVSVAPLPEQEQVRQAALSDASSAEIEFLPDGAFISRESGQVLLTRLLEIDDSEREHWEFEKAPGQRVRVERLADGSLSIRQPERPLAQFRRA